MILVIILTGILVGIISTFFGLGGGSIIVPVLYTIFPKLAPETVISTSLGVIFLNNFFNVFKFKKKGLNAHYKLIFPMAITMIVGVVLGAKITEILPAIWLKRVFSAVLISSSVFILIRKSPDGSDITAEIIITKGKLIISVIFALFAGIIAATTGVGGAIIIIPMFIHVLKIPFRLIPVNANLIVLIGAIFGSIMYMINLGQVKSSLDFGFEILQRGPVNLNLILIIAFFAFFTSFLGLKWSQKVRPLRAKQIFAVMLLIAALNILRTTF